MAIIRLAQPFDAFHGTVAGPSAGTKITLFSTPKSSGVSRQWVSPANPQSTNQMLIRGYQIAAAAAYSALTQAQAAVWIQEAEQLHRSNILHLTYTLSGINLFVMVNAYRQINAQSILDDCPVIEMPAAPTAVSLVTKPGPDRIAFLGHFPGAKVGERGMARVSARLPSPNRRARKNDVSLIGTFTDMFATPVAGLATFIIYITPADYTVGDFIGVELTPLSATYFPGAKFLEPSIQIG